MNSNLSNLGQCRNFEKLVKKKVLVLKIFRIIHTSVFASQYL